MKSAAIIFLAVPASGYSAETNPDSATFYLNKAIEFNASKKTPEALAAFNKALIFSPANHEIRLTYIDFLLTDRKYFIAYEQLQKVLESDGQNQKALTKVIEISFLLHRWEDVISAAEKISSNDSKINFMIGKAYAETEDFGLAEKSLLLSFQQNSSNYDALLLLGKVYIELSNYAAAISFYNRALNVDENSNEVIYHLGLLYSTMNNEKEAIKYYELAAEKGYKQDLDYKENLGMAYLSVDLKRGIQILNSVLEKKPNDHEILYQVAHAHYKFRNYQEAADGFYKLYQIDNSDVKSLYMTGIAYHKKGDRLLADTYCNKAIELDPTLGYLKTLRYAN